MARREEIKTEVDTLLRDAKDRRAVTEALTFLFPKLGNILDVPATQYADPPGRSPRQRISNAEFARTYFSLTPDETVWGKSQADAMFVGAPQEAFDSFRARLARTPPRDRAKLRRVFIDLLSAITRQTDRPLDWFMALVENARSLLELVPDTNLGLFDLEIDSQITFLLTDILKPLDETARDKIISHAIANAADISFLCDVFRSFIGDVEPDGAKGQSKDAFGKNTDTLRDLLVGKVVDTASSGRLYAQVRPQDILWFWWGSGHGKDARRHTAEALDDPATLRSLLKMSIGTVRSSTGNYERVNRRSWSKIVDLKELHRRALEISTDPGDPNYETSRRFLTAYDRDDQDSF